MRPCADCPAVISEDRRADAIRCVPCAQARRRALTSAWVADKRRVCMDCPATIPASKPPNTKRCSACSERAIRDNRRRANTGVRPWRAPPAARLKSAAPPLADRDMTPQRVIEVDGEQFEVVFGGGEGLSSVSGRGSSLVEGRGAVRRNGSIVMGGVS